MRKLIVLIVAAGCGTVHSNAQPDAAAPDAGGGFDSRPGLPDAAPGTIGFAIVESQIIVAQNGSANVDVTVSHGPGVNGAITVSISGAPAGVTAPPLVLAASATSGALTISAAPTTAQGPGTLTLVAQATGAADATASVPLVVAGPPASPDDGFGTKGIAADAFLDANQPVMFAAARRLGGGYVAVGTDTDTSGNLSLALAGYTEDGEVDATFASTGHLVTKIVGYSNPQCESIAVQPSDGSIVVGCRATNATDDDAVVARFDLNGHLDTSFGTLGFAVYDGGGNEGTATIAVTPGGIVVAVNLDFGMPVTRLARLSISDGKIDTSFGTNGFTDVQFGTTPQSATASIADGPRTFVTGTYLQSNAHPIAWEVKATGDQDMTFGSSGFASGFESGRPNAIFPSAAGGWLIGGNFFLGAAHGWIGHLLADGTVDPSVNSGTGFETIDADDVTGIGEQADGKIVFAGTQSPSSVVTAVVGRGNADGSADPAFPTTQIGVDGTPVALFVDPPGELTVIGNPASGSGWFLARVWQ